MATRNDGDEKEVEVVDEQPVWMTLLVPGRANDGCVG